ncbi:transmembrane 220 family protein [Membranicola marinus]|uniref:Transmembrane 220 family protein n=1 Tax=Membranihabitans marinus TaxID=1227546 RepID=A0A953LBN4_9BACT|nr:transmembrane 220 family protein [Membranihabitans marinus]MBY5956834.1 transmembrane 220 family protein [Membranihabitans marinus]
MILLNIIFTLAFIAFAYVNLNDADSWLWVPIYMYAALLCAAAVFGYAFPLAYLAGIIFYLIYALILFFKKDGVWDWVTKHSMQNIAETMQATKPWVEQTREFFGLLIVAGALALNYYTV